MTQASKWRCVAYAAIALIALIATWSQNIAYLNVPGTFFVEFLGDLKVNAAARSFTVDIILFFLAAAILMVVEARKHGVRFVWAYIAGGLLIAISVTFPLFLIAREMRIGGTEPARLTALDTALLGLMGIGSVAMTVWVDVL